jgi:hypothetical protein
MHLAGWLFREGKAMMFLRAIQVLAPWIIYECLAMIASIFTPVIILLLSLRRSFFEITSFTYTLNQVGKIHEIMLILLPIAALVILANIMLAYDLGRKDTKIDVNPAVFMCAFVLIIFVVIVDMSIMAFFMFVYFDEKLDGETLNVARSAIYTAITCFIWLVIGGSIARHWPETHFEVANAASIPAPALEKVAD